MYEIQVMAHLKHTVKAMYSTVWQIIMVLACSRVYMTSHYNIMTNTYPQSADKNPKHLFQHYMKPHQSFLQYALPL